MTNPFKKGTKNYLFYQIAQPDENGISRWVLKSEFVGEYADLMFQNGASWCRAESSLAKKYIIEFDKSLTPGNSVDAIRLNGFNNTYMGTQAIRADIKNYYKQQRCVVLGTSKPEVDHKNGWKNNIEVMTMASQKFSDFQPLSKAANDAKRQFCKVCEKTGERFDAKKLGYPMSFYKGGNKHDGSQNGCEGCFLHDPIEFRKHLKFEK